MWPITLWQRWNVHSNLFGFQASLWSSIQLKWTIFALGIIYSFRYFGCFQYLKFCTKARNFLSSYPDMFCWSFHLPPKKAEALWKYTKQKSRKSFSWQEKWNYCTYTTVRVPSELTFTHCRWLVLMGAMMQKWYMGATLSQISNLLYTKGKSVDVTSNSWPWWSETTALKNVLQ